MNHQIARNVLFVLMIAALFKNVVSYHHFGGLDRNVKQCIFKHLNDGRDHGQIASCDFVKHESGSGLRVTYQGDLRVVTCPGGQCCRRWHITINGRECSHPAPIDVAIYASKHGHALNLHRPGTLDGICDKVPKGTVKVGLSVGKCKHSIHGNAFTCWGSVCRFIIEEIPEQF
ncbi:collagen triple helix repeat-containing protein 1-like [Dendronephthya gigantea]|uniref:collagen triple helix repeat-containing protein 1-like n=1 Tax=Dendronephthya gigantea TaxID=151771 RepID=UPI00106D7702|nr:collagen triple helix repeat-containing protein 1-like [Dendronephthya gigantea]